MTGAVQGNQHGVDSVLRPAVGGGLQRLVERGAAGSRPDGAEHLLGHRVGVGSAVPADHLERLVRPLAGAGHRPLPPAVVTIVEAGKEAGEGSTGAGLELLGQAVAEDLGAAALENRRGPQDVAHDGVPFLCAARPPALHTLAGLLTLGRSGHAVVVEHLPGRLGVEDVVAEDVGASLRKMDVQRRVTGPQPPRLVVDLLPPARPAVAQPDADDVAGRGGRLGPVVQRELAAQPGLTVQEPDFAEHLLDGMREQVVAAGGDLDLGQALAALAERAVPLGALGRLQPVLVADIHEHAVPCQRLQRAGDPVTPGTGIGGDVVDHKIGQRVGVGADAEIRAFLPRQLPDQEDQPAEVALQSPLAAVVIELLDTGVELVQQHSGADQARRQRVEEIAAGNGRPERAVGHVRERVVQDAQLRTELAVTAGGIDGLEARLPEAPPRAEQRIVGDPVGRVLGPRRHPSALQVTGDLARMRLEHPVDLGTRARPLVQEHLAGHRLDVGIGQLDRDPEAVPEPQQRRRAGRERRLPGAHEHDAAVELGLHRLGHLRQSGRPILSLVDVLLHLVEHQDGMRQLPVVRQRLPRGLDELVGRDVGPQRRELPGQQLPRRPDVGREAGVRRDQRVGDDGADVEVVELAQPVLPRRLDRRPDAVDQPPLAQPEAEARLGILRGPATSTEQNRQHGVPDVIDAAPEHGSGGRHGRPPRPVRVGVQLAKLGLNLVGQPATNETAGGRPLGEPGVHPQVGEHLQEVRLAAAEKAADPRRLLLRGPEVCEIAVENALERVAKLPVADEGLELGPQLLHGRLVGVVRDARLPAVGEPRRPRIAIECFVNLHGTGPPPCSVIPWAR